MNTERVSISPPNLNKNPPREIQNINPRAAKELPLIYSREDDHPQIPKDLGTIPHGSECRLEEIIEALSPKDPKRNAQPKPQRNINSKNNERTKHSTEESECVAAALPCGRRTVEEPPLLQQAKATSGGTGRHGGALDVLGGERCGVEREGWRRDGGREG